MEDSKKVLIRVSNLKQWFPLKKRGLYVKANDGISIDIYEGETFGLVGESGCGKSTLGRTLLQFYKQTDGRSLYYGRDVNEFAPGYVRATISKLPSLRAKWKKLEAERDKLQAAYDKMSEQEQFAANDKLRQATKAANDVFLDMTSIIGGFLVADDLAPVQKIYLERFSISHKIKNLVERKILLERDLADVTFSAQKKAGEGKDVSSNARVKSAQGKVDAAEAEIAAERKNLAAIEQRIDEMRKKYDGNADFAKYEAYRDNGIDLARLTYNEMRLLRSDLQLIFQDPYSSLNPRMTVGQIIGEGMLAHGMFKRNDERMQAEILRVMDDCGLAPYFLHRFPHQFSGGQRQRIGIARSLAVRPKFVVCDEAVSALDVSIQSQIINLLQDLKDKQNLTYMFITHDLSVVKYISDRIGVMYLGAMVELADSQEIFDHPRHPYTEALLKAIPTTDVGDNKKALQILEGDIPSPVHPPKGCKFHTRCKYCTEICTQVVPEWEEVGPNHFVACHHKLAD